MKLRSFAIAGFLTIAAAGCAKKTEQNAASGSAAATGSAVATGSAAAAGSAAATGSAAVPAPTGEPPTFHPKCATLLPTALIAKTHGADAVAVDSDGDQSASCRIMKGSDAVGVYSVDCVDGFDKEAAQTFEIERGAQQAAKAMEPLVGRAGYRMGDTSFTLLDDDTPCRMMVSWLTAPAADAWPEHLKSLMAALTPAAIK
ncbi:MAG TPA: hypothetical protein VM261_00575 [Kofleriaceae bacterium]|nr:hypothetical protein [Kofleriaceae bacterium]